MVGTGGEDEEGRVDRGARVKFEVDEMERERERVAHDGMYDTVDDGPISGSLPWVGIARRDTCFSEGRFQSKTPHHGSRNPGMPRHACQTSEGFRGLLLKRAKLRTSPPVEMCTSLQLELGNSSASQVSCNARRVDNLGLEQD